MSTFTLILSIWGGVTAVFVVLLIYKSTLNMHEDDQLFLDDAENHMRDEQEELMAKMNRLTPYLRFLGAASAVIFVALAGMWVYTGLNQ